MLSLFRLLIQAVTRFPGSNSATPQWVDSTAKQMRLPQFKQLQGWERCKLRLDPGSIQFRLTMGITGLIVLGLGSVGFWTSWQMQQILIASHKQNVISTAERFAEDVGVYSDMYAPPESVERAIVNRSTSNTLIWVNQPDGSVLARSAQLSTADWQTWNIPEMLAASVPLDRTLTQVYELDSRYLVVCREMLLVEGEALGTFYVLQDITIDQQKFVAVNRTLGLTVGGAILGISAIAAWYVQRSLQPLEKIAQMTRAISTDNLEQQRLDLPTAPTEVRELVDTFNMLLGRIADAWGQQRFAAERQHQFVSNVSHELRTPLTIVYGYLQSLLRRSANLTDSQREALTIASTEADQTIRLLQDLLDLARADDGYMALHLEPFILNDLVTEVVGMAEQYSDRTIVIDTDEPMLAIYADRNRLKQVLLNLIDNAMKYSEPETPVTVRLAERPPNIVVIQVTDQGQGIPLAQQARIFERFYRGDEARSRYGTRGYGLGLSIVKTLVAAMQGTISVRSQLGEGTVFTVMLPAPSPHS